MPCNLYIANKTAKPVTLPRVIIVACVTSVPTGIIHITDDKMYMLEKKALMPTEMDKFLSDPFVNAV